MQAFIHQSFFLQTKCLNCCLVQFCTCAIYLLLILGVYVVAVCFFVVKVRNKRNIIFTLLCVLGCFKCDQGFSTLNLLCNCKH